MRSARFALVVVTVGALTLAGVLAAQQPKPAKPMQLEKVKDGLFVIRGPFNPCAPNGCGGAYGDDGLLHEAGDVAVRVTSEGLILVDDKFQNNVTEILEHVKSVSALPVKYLLNTHHHTDHAGGDAVFINTTEIIAHRNVRENFLRNKQPGAPRVTFNDQASVFLGGAEVRAYYFGRAQDGRHDPGGMSPGLDDRSPAELAGPGSGHVEVVGSAHVPSPNPSAGSAPLGA